MILDVPTMITLLQKRVGNNNGLTNIPSEYIDDIEEVVTTYVNPQIGTNIEVVGDNFVADIDIDTLIFGIILVRTEIHILDRKIEQEVEVAVTADTPAGRINTAQRPQLRKQLRRDELSDRYWKLCDTYIFGLPATQGSSLDMTAV